MNFFRRNIFFFTSRSNSIESSVTRFGKILKALCYFERIYLVFLKCLNLLWQILNEFWQNFIGLKDWNWTNNLAIWSHWLRECFCGCGEKDKNWTENRPTKDDDLKNDILNETENSVSRLGHFWKVLPTNCLNIWHILCYLENIPLFI